MNTELSELDRKFDGNKIPAQLWVHRHLHYQTCYDNWCQAALPSKPCTDKSNSCTGTHVMAMFRK